jgi:protein-disulfide isomerase
LADFREQYQMRSKLYFTQVALTVLVAGCFWQNAVGADTTTAAGNEQIYTELEALKAGQQAILKELAEIRKLVTPKKREVVSDIDVVLDVAGDPVKGSPDARLALVEFTDYQCPFCGRHVKSVLPPLLKDYVDSGKVRYVIRDYPLPFHKDARNAAYAAHCAGEQGKYWEMHDVLFGNQKALGRDKLSEHAGNLELDVAAFDECVDSGRYAGKVDASLKDGARATVRGTPSFVVGMVGADGKVKGTKIIRGAVGLSVFKTTLDEALNKGKEPVAKVGK